MKVLAEHVGFHGRTTLLDTEDGVFHAVNEKGRAIRSRAFASREEADRTYRQTAGLPAKTEAEPLIERRRETPARRGPLPRLQTRK